MSEEETEVVEEEEREVLTPETETVTATNPDGEEMEIALSPHQVGDIIAATPPEPEEEEEDVEEDV